jgi:hypothetical protein
MNKESVDKYPAIKPAFEFPPDIIFYCKNPETDLRPLQIRTLQNSES